MKAKTGVALMLTGAGATLAIMNIANGNFKKMVNKYSKMMNKSKNKLEDMM